MTRLLNAWPVRAVAKAWRVGLVVLLLSLFVLVSLGKGGLKVLGIVLVAGVVAPFVEIALLLPTVAGVALYAVVVLGAACHDAWASPQEVLQGLGSYRLSRRMLLGPLVTLLCAAAMAMSPVLWR